MVAYLALFVALGGSAYAAGHLGKNTVGPKQLKKNAVTSAKIKNEAVTAAKVKNGSLTGAQIKAGTLTGNQIDLSTLGTVPNAQNAQTAQTANAVAPSEAWHEVGAPGEPNFQSEWHNNVPEAHSNVAFYKDREGIVHLKGEALGSGSGGTVFQLPPGYRPAKESILGVTAICGTCNPEAQPLAIAGTDVLTFQDGQINLELNSGASVRFDGITFRAES